MTVVVDSTHTADEISHNMQIKHVLFLSEPQRNTQEMHTLLLHKVLCALDVYA
jgi:hypothetical protein